MRFFAMLCQTNDYHYGESFAHHMKRQLNQIPIENISNFSNGRYIRNLFEKTSNHSVKPANPTGNDYKGTADDI
ncbi:hypothetical protein OL548_24140 [Lysinibacillus sp. MHQ-1]|nr:hypothetical protein OL548_24140 [Lysinibacillus sp. MHQ-1]